MSSFSGLREITMLCYHRIEYTILKNLLEDNMKVKGGVDCNN
jgi:hypothetical protein